MPLIELAELPLFTNADRLELIRSRLFADPDPPDEDFEHNSGCLLDRLDAVTQLMFISELDDSLSDDACALISREMTRLKQRSTALRHWLLDHPSPANELGLIKRMLHRQEQLWTLDHFIYVVAYEWATFTYSHHSQRLTDQHRGDLVLMNDDYQFLVLEAKYIRTDNVAPRFCKRLITLRTRFVCQQAQKFAGFFELRFPWADVDYLALTNHGLYQKAKRPIQKVRSIL